MSAFLPSTESLQLLLVFIFLSTEIDVSPSGNPSCAPGWSGSQRNDASTRAPTNCQVEIANGKLGTTWSIIPRLGYVVNH